MMPRLANDEELMSLLPRGYLKVAQHTCSLTASLKCSLLRKTASFALPTRPDGTDLRAQPGPMHATIAIDLMSAWSTCQWSQLMPGLDQDTALSEGL